MNHPFKSKEPSWMAESDVTTEEWSGLWHDLDPQVAGTVTQGRHRRLNDPIRSASGLEPSRAIDSYFLCHPDLSPG